MALMATVAAPADAAPSLALPETVRVNVAGLGIVAGRFGSTATLTATDPAGTVVHQGGAPVMVRTNVYRMKDGFRLPDRRTPPADLEERQSRLALLREARIAERSAGAAGAERAIEVVPFEVAVLSGTDPIGEVALQVQKPVMLRFTSTDGLVTFEGRPFRGTLELAIDDEGDLIVVNTVRTFDYLASVVGAEVPSSWHPEALAAQAIAARTYLETHLKRHKAYDLEGDVRDQAYHGLSSEDRATVRAVERTAGIVATYRGAAIEALYSANAGGVTESSENVFANALPYLRSVESPWDREAENSSWGRTSWSWTKEITAPQLGHQLAQRALDVGEPERIEVTQVSPTGRVLQARVVGSKATRDIGKDRSRYYFGLMSALFTVTRTGGGEVEKVAYLNATRIRELESLGARLV
ncbi:MAG: SpoIID/LytB domain-containing protein, partial [Chloroflexi bacterium]|nr:SpoIID/LytB domain-containing protein [Chloroflexota bacterium]